MLQVFEEILEISVIMLKYLFVMRSMKKDRKLTIMKFEIIKYVVDECLTNI